MRGRLTRAEVIRDRVGLMRSNDRRVNADANAGRCLIRCHLTDR